MSTLRISGRGVDLGDALRSRVEERITAALAKYFDGSCSGHVTLTRDGSGYRSDCVLHLASGTTLEASGSAHDPTASFEAMAERIEKRLRRYKRRVKDRPGNGAAEAPGLEAAYSVLEAPADFDLDEEDEEPVTGDHPLVIAESHTLLRQISVRAAVEDLDLRGVPVVVFVHAGSGRVNVVYRRGDGSIGWIDPPERRPS